jgi:hypothetical protein
MAEISGGEVIARMLQKEGVEKVFGIIDGTYFGFYSALHRLGIEIVTPRHETCAAHMAGTYARLTGKLGVCMASNGPGVANLLPGLVVEQADGNRVLAITSARRPSIMYPGPRRQLPVLRPERRHRQDRQVERGGVQLRPRPGAGAEGPAQELGRPARRGASRRAGDHHERQGQGRGGLLGAAPVPQRRAAGADAEQVRAGRRLLIAGGARR